MAWTETEILCGIYKITSPTGRVYIGQSIDIIKRWKKQYKQSNLKAHCGCQPKLYNSLLKYGWEAHLFEVVELCRQEELNERERFYVSLYDSRNGKVGLNCTVGGDGTRGLKWSDESKGRARESKRKLYESGYVSPLIGKPLSEDRKRKMSEYMKGLLQGEKNPFFGKKHTEESRKKIGEKSVGRPKTEDGIKKMQKRMKGEGNPMYGVSLCGEKNGMYGRKHTEGTKAKMHRKLSSEQIEGMRKRQLGKKHSEESKLKISESLKGNKYALGFKHTEERNNKIRLVHLGAKRSEESKKRMSAARKGIKLSNEHRVKLSVARSKLIINTETGIFYQSSEDAWRAYGFQSLSCFRHKLIGRIKNNTSYIYA